VIRSSGADPKLAAEFIALKVEVACPYLGALNPEGNGTIRDQLSLAVAITGSRVR
jgi:hypothetical protein